MSMLITFGDHSANGAHHVLELPETRPSSTGSEGRRGAPKRPAEDSVLLTVSVANTRRTYTCVMPETERLEAAVTSIASAPADSLTSQSARLSRGAVTLLSS